MKIAMIDPSLFTLPYDLALSRALHAKGCEVTLHGRPVRPLERVARLGTLHPSFYTWSERIRGRVPGALFNVTKGAEHAIDLARLLRAFRRARPSVVHFQWCPVPALDLLAVRSIRLSTAPVVLTVHDAKPFNNSPTSALQRIGSRNIWREFDHLIVHSEASRTMLASQGIPAAQVSVVPHGILNTVNPSTAPAPESAPLTILLFGKIKTYKGVDVMIEALGRLPPALRAKCRVAVVGEPIIPVAPMQDRAAALGVAGNVTWDLRFVSDADMAKVFAQADLFAFPYREIDTSGVLMACLPYGKPIIASAVGAFPTLLKDGIHGRIVPPDDPDSLAQALAALLDNPELRQACARNVAALSAQIPSWDTIADQTVAVYESVIRARADSARVPPLSAQTA